MAKLIKTTFQFRRDTAANWLLNKDVVPAAGEPCFETDTGVFKIGDGVTTYENLEPIRGARVDADGKSIVLEDNVLKLAGFDTAVVGAQLRKGENGIEWIIPADAEEVKEIKSEVAEIKSNVFAIQEILVPSEGTEQPLLARVETLEGSVEVLNGVGEGSVRKIAQDEATLLLNDFAAKISDDGTVNTFKELIDYASEHQGAANALVQDITTLKGLVGFTSVADQITTAVDELKETQILPLQDALNQFPDVYLSKVQAAAEFEHVKYEISNTPVGTLVDYGEKEIRIMVPTDAKFEQQTVGSTGNANMYYMSFKAYAPAGAVSFKEGDRGVIVDEMFTFDDDFAGVDAYGRKYSICWLALASYDATSDTWNYYGTNSNVNKYIGWTYCVEWYDANGVKIDSDMIRINLSNESCHNVIEPYYMAGVVKEVSFNGTTFETVDGKVDITYEDEMDVKASEEITIDEDGTLGVGKISFSKIEQEVGELIIFDGGGAV